MVAGRKILIDCGYLVTCEVSQLDVSSRGRNNTKTQSNGGNVQPKRKSTAHYLTSITHTHICCNAKEQHSFTIENLELKFNKQSAASQYHSSTQRRLVSPLLCIYIWVSDNPNVLKIGGEGFCFHHIWFLSYLIFLFFNKQNENWAYVKLIKMKGLLCSQSKNRFSQFQ